MRSLPAPKRPRTVTITFWSVIFLGTWNFGRAIAIGQQLNLQDVLNLQPDPRLRLVAAGLFTFLFFMLAWQLGRKRPFTIQAVPITIGWYTVYETAVWLIFAQPPRNWSLWLISSLFLISTALFTRWALRRAAQTYF
ncbi:MAG: hypothetical protein WAS33_17105 [Candidatus Promineifilaceae bacterium]|nr:hypothetical protein [Anaerolineaceae bacterium]